MKRLFLYIILICFNLTVVWGQRELNERVYVHLDKECYVAGEEMYVKFLVVDSDLNSSSFSKVGYIEVCDTEKPHVQVKIALDHGKGAGKITIPLDVPSGIYELSAYTRYMRNEGEQVFFKRELAIVNMGMNSENDRIELIDNNDEIKQTHVNQSTVNVSTDKSSYLKRSEVRLSINNLPENVSDLVVSVMRNDSITYIPCIDNKKWLEQVVKKNSISMPWKWLPEYEGHIISGRIQDEGRSALLKGQYAANISFVGNDIRYIQGQVKDDGLIYFYTGDIYGPQEIVTSIVSYNGLKYNMELVSPFSGVLPKSLPALRLKADDKRLIDRFVGVQLQQIMGVDSLDNPVSLEKYYDFQNPTVYDLNEYTRFNTLEETIIEFVNQVVVRKGKLDRRVMKVLIPDENRFSSGNTLVLLDGVAIHNHEELLKYNPRNIRTIQIYNGRYLFGGQLYECMISFTSHRQNLSSIQLDDTSQLLVYDCPFLPEMVQCPEYADEQVRNSMKPDFRHTLYWNPFVESLIDKSSAALSFYTSDLSGEYKIVVEGFTKEGKSIYGEAFFGVSP